MPEETLKDVDRGNRAEIAPSHPTTKHRSGRSERYALGKSLRQQCPRDLHSVWKPADDRPDPVDLVLHSDKGRLPDLFALRACATFGLVLGGLVGGPVARLLISHHRLIANPATGTTGEAAAIGFEEPKAVRLITPEDFVETLALVAICITVGSTLGA